MAELRYRGIAYRQSSLGDAPWLVTFVAASEELLNWAGIPRKSEHNLTGFQRPMDDRRVAETKKFFDMPANQSPTALIVGVPKPTPGLPSQVELLFEGEADRNGIRPCELVVQLAETAEPLTEAVQRLKAQLMHRLKQEEERENGSRPSQSTPTFGQSGISKIDALPSADSSVEGEEEEDVEGDDEEDTDGEDEGDEEEEDARNSELELGVSIIGKLLGKLDDPEWVDAQEEHIRDLVKPAVIIDGQHRVKGAEACERGIPFTVCAIMDAPWSEEVFQFTVVNHTAKGIPDAFITANAALSLTRGELQELKIRLQQAGVKIVEYELMQVVNFDTRSPFYDLVDLGDKRQADRLGYKTMVQVARAWWDGRHQVFGMILPNLYPEIKGIKKKRRRIDEWHQSQDWGDFLFSFWDEVYSTYKTEKSHVPGRTLWEPGNSQLTTAVVLLELQRAFLDNLNSQDPSYFEAPDGEDPRRFLLQQVSKRAKQFVQYFPAAFFETKWSETSLNTGPGRQDLQDAFMNLVTKKGQYQYAKSALVAGKNS